MESTRSGVDATVLCTHSTEWSPPSGVAEIVREWTTPAGTMQRIHPVRTRRVPP
ncbi:hypothetical protein [Streptomyces sp. 900105245]